MVIEDLKCTPTYCHGSSSASLISFFEWNNPGLKPTGTLLQEDKVPYGGELFWGIGQQGINQHSVSVYDWRRLEHALDYVYQTVRNAWNPESSSQKINRSIKLIQKCDLELTDPTLEDYLKQHISAKKSSAENSIKIEELRLQRWPSLDQWQKDLVLNPYAVLFGINYDGQVNYSGGELCEFTIPGTVGLECLTLFVPISKVNSVQELAADFGKSVRILSLESLNSEDLSQNAQSALSYLL